MRRNALRNEHLVAAPRRCRDCRAPAATLKQLLDLEQFKGSCEDCHFRRCTCEATAKPSNDAGAPA